MNRFYAFCIAAGILCSLIVIGVWNHAHGKNYEHVICDNEPDPELCNKIWKWYVEVKQPGDSVVGCCGVGDAYWVRIDKVLQDGIIVIVEDDREIKGREPRNGQHIFVDNNKIDDRHQGNPTGHDILFIGGQVYCYFPGSGT